MRAGFGTYVAIAVFLAIAIFGAVGLLYAAWLALFDPVPIGD